MLRLLIGLVAAAFVAACSTVPEQRKIVTTTTIFQGPDHLKRGTIAVKPLDKIQEGSLEFKSVSEYLAKWLGLLGYIPTDDAPSYIAYISYGIDNGKTTSTSMPIYGQTGGGTSYTSGTVSSGSRFGTYSGTTTTMPTFGQIGAIPVDYTTFKRVVLIDIFRLENSQQPIKVYEIKAASAGSCGNINSVLPSIIDGIFANVPGENGKSKTAEIPWNGTC